MKRTLATAAQLMLVTALAGQSLASGIGASIYVQRPVGPPVAGCPTGGCPPVASCNSCQRLGFACVDHATPAPCTAEGGCYPARATFGWNRTNWRRWPGTEEGGPAPLPADASDALVPPFEEPAPEDEDQQAPPSLESELEAAADEGEPAPSGTAAPRPAVEVELPPLPEPALPRPGRPAAPAGQDAPPALPFGFRGPAVAPRQDAWAPPAPPSVGMPASLPKPGADAPPPLPQGFTGVSPTTTLRRLPSPIHFDGAVTPASATLPSGARR